MGWGIGGPSANEDTHLYLQHVHIHARTCTWLRVSAVQVLRGKTIDHHENDLRTSDVSSHYYLMDS